VRLKVRLSGVLPSLLHVPASELVIEAAAGSTLSDVMRSLDVPAGAAMAFSVNGRVRPPEFRPQDGDEIVAIPSIAGG
jgi:sulfur carrier protein ThiS